MLSPTVDTVRLFLHVVAASVWVGGQLVLAGVVANLRRDHGEALPIVARTFGRIAWPAFAVVVVTGLWGIVAIDVAETSTAYQVTLFVKLIVALASGAAAAVHQIGTGRTAKAVGGALAFVAALAAAYLGFLLTTGS